MARLEEVARHERLMSKSSGLAGPGERGAIRGYLLSPRDHAFIGRGDGLGIRLWERGD